MCAEEKFPAFKELHQEPLSAEEAQLLLHELQGQQIELERQNEELRRTQQELEMSRARYFDLYNLAPVGYLTVDENGVILDANLSAAAMLGMVQNDLLEKPITQFILDEDQDVYYLHGKQACEIRMVRADGSLFWVGLKAAPRHNGECGITLNDITERKLLEEAEKQIARVPLGGHRQRRGSRLAARSLRRTCPRTRPPASDKDPPRDQRQPSRGSHLGTRSRE